MFKNIRNTCLYLQSMIQKQSFGLKKGEYLGYEWYLEIEKEEDNIIEWLSIFRNGVRYIVPSKFNKRRFPLELIQQIIEDIDARH
jgi:hypothetical protein